MRRGKGPVSRRTYEAALAKAERYRDALHIATNARLDLSTDLRIAKEEFAKLWAQKETADTAAHNAVCDREAMREKLAEVEQRADDRVAAAKRDAGAAVEALSGHHKAEVETVRKTHAEERAKIDAAHAEQLRCLVTKIAELEAQLALIPKAFVDMSKALAHLAARAR